MTAGITGILLAAGMGSRFGGDKLLHPLADGMPMGVVAARKLRAVCPRVVAVLKPGDDVLAHLLANAGCELIVCEDANNGMGHSLAAGVRAVNAAGGWIVALGDMPFIHHDTYQTIAAALISGAPLVAPQYLGKRGHPVGFSDAWYDQLSTLSGDQGARYLIKAHEEQLRLYPVTDPGILRDIDHLTDLANHQAG